MTGDGRSGRGRTKTPVTAQDQLINVFKSVGQVVGFRRASNQPYVELGAFRHQGQVAHRSILTTTYVLYTLPEGMVVGLLWGRWERVEEE